MSGRAPRHRAEMTPAGRKREAQFVLAALGFLACLVLLVWLAVLWDKVLLAIGLTIGSCLGAWWHDKRKSRARGISATDHE